MLYCVACLFGVCCVCCLVLTCVSIVCWFVSCWVVWFVLRVPLCVVIYVCVGVFCVAFCMCDVCAVLCVVVYLYCVGFFRVG